MSDTVVQVAPDSTGSKIATRTITVGGTPVMLQCVVLGDPTTADSYTAVTAKGTQGAFGLAVQELKDAGRTPITLFCDAISNTASEAAATATQWKGGTSASATTFAVTAGKTLRITGMSVSIANGGATLTNTRVRLRWSTTTLATTSAVAIALAAAAGTATSGAAGVNALALGDGYEIAASNNYGLSHVENTTSTITICVTGYEY